MDDINAFPLETFLSSYSCDTCEKEFSIDPKKSPENQYWYHKRDDDIDYCTSCFQQHKKNDNFEEDDYVIINLYENYMIKVSHPIETSPDYFYNYTPLTDSEKEIPEHILLKVEDGNYLLKLLLKYMYETPYLLEHLVSINSSSCDPYWNGDNSILDSFDPDLFGSVANWMPFEAENDTFFCINIAKKEPLFGSIASGVIDETGNVGLDFVYENYQEFEKDKKLYQKFVKENSKIVLNFGEWCRRKYWLRNRLDF